MTHYWRLRRYPLQVAGLDGPPPLYGEHCRVLARGRGPGPRNILVEMADGRQVVTSMWAVRRLDG